MSYPDLDYKIASFEGLLLSLGKKPKVEQLDMLFSLEMFLQLKITPNLGKPKSLVRIAIFLDAKKTSFPSARSIQKSSGKGANQAVAAKRLGAAVRFVGRLGRDGHGEWCHGWHGHGELGG